MKFIQKINVIIVAKAPKIIQCPILPAARPYPDAFRLPEYHYKNYKETPLVNVDGELRKPDDFQDISYVYYWNRVVYHLIIRRH